MKLYTQNMSRPPRYRWRTWLRGRLPWRLAAFFPAGPKDCGNHEWFRADDDTDLCRHCLVGEREHKLMPVDWSTGLWRELRQEAEEGSPVALKIVERRRAEEKAAQRAA